VHVPAVDLPRLAKYLRTSVIGVFHRRSLINQRLAKGMPSWTHSGFSLNMSVNIPWPAAGREANGGRRVPAGRPARQARLRAGRVVTQAMAPAPGPRGAVRRPAQGMAAAAPAAASLSVQAALRDNVEPSASTRASRSALHGTPWSWARLLAKVYELDALRCSRCGPPKKVLAVITDPSEVRRILLHLIKTGVAPPGLEAFALN
jgi:hypothetical protein